MYKGIGIFFSGIVLCFIMVKVLGGPGSDAAATEVDNSALIARIAKVEGYENDIKNLKAQVAKNAVPKISDSDAGISKKVVAEMISAAIKEDRKNRPVISGAAAGNFTDQLKATLENEDTRKELTSSITKAFTDRYRTSMKDRLLKDIEVSDAQGKELDVIWESHQASLRKVGESIREKLGEDSTREERRELWKTEMETLNAASNEKVKVVFNDEAKYAQYTKNTKSMRSWGRRGR